jgi:hypothetical protein
MSTHADFWEILGISDTFDRAYIVAQVRTITFVSHNFVSVDVCLNHPTDESCSLSSNTQIERFCSLYSIRAISLEDISDQLFVPDDPESIAHDAVAGMHVSPSNTATGTIVSLPSYMNPTATAAAAAAAAVDVSKFSKKQTAVLYQASKAAANAEHALVHERRQNFRREQRRVSLERKEQKNREKEESAKQKATERAVRESEREERRRRKLELREERERFAHEQKEAALKRAAELVSSNRVPIEITRGVAAAKAAQLAILAGSLGQPPMALPPPSPAKKRSAVIVSTASDLNQIVIHSKNLWAKYNAIAKEHNQKVNWITVARELGINVKVREKYARMHARAEQRGFDWIHHGHWKIKDHAEVWCGWNSVSPLALRRIVPILLAGLRMRARTHTLLFSICLIVCISLHADLFGANSG